jgi:hypothetical protein
MMGLPDTIIFPASAGTSWPAASAGFVVLGFESPEKLRLRLGRIARAVTQNDARSDLRRAIHYRTLKALPVMIFARSREARDQPLALSGIFALGNL